MHRRVTFGLRRCRSWAATVGLLLVSLAACFDAEDDDSGDALDLRGEVGSCPGDVAPNACGGCDNLAASEGAPCGACGTGVWACDEGDLRCQGDLGRLAPADSCGPSLVCVQGECLPSESCAADSDCPGEDDVCQLGVCVPTEVDLCIVVQAVGMWQNAAGDVVTSDDLEEVPVGTVLVLGIVPELMPEAGPWQGQWVVDAPAESALPASMPYALEGVDAELDAFGEYVFELTELSDGAGRGPCHDTSLTVRVEVVLGAAQCDDLQCEAAQRECLPGVGDEDATCGGCLSGHVEEGGACRPVLGCVDLDCAAVGRECVAGSGVEDAVCGSCLEGLEEVETLCLPPLAAPASVVASEGTSAIHVRVTWSTVSGATGYHVYRDGVRVTSAPLLGTSYDDADAAPGGVPGEVQALHATTDRSDDVRLTWTDADVAAGPAAFYQVRTVSGARQSALSSGASGYRGGLPVQGYEVQVDEQAWVQVGDVVAWVDDSAPAGSVTVGLPGATTALSDRVDVSVAASSTTPGMPRRYRVRAVNAMGAGAAASEVEGHRGVGLPSYAWEWSTSDEGPFDWLRNGAARLATDTDIPLGETRWYRVWVFAQGAEEVVSSAVAGWRASGTTPLGGECTADAECLSGMWCPTATQDRRCSPNPTIGGVSFPFRWVPGGTFMVGSPPEEVGHVDVREDQVLVTLTRDYFVQQTPVTQGQWFAAMQTWNARPDASRTMTGWTGPTPLFGLSPSYFGPSGTGECSDSTCPVERVSWWDAVVYANVLSIVEGLTPCYTLSGCSTGSGLFVVGAGCPGTSRDCTSTGNFSCTGASFVGKSCPGYRLLTEAEWERAARAGTTTATYAGDLSTATGCATLSGGNGFPEGMSLGEIAWYSCNSGQRTHAVGQGYPNQWGLHDMAGNIREWTWNRYQIWQSGGTDPLGPSSGTARVLRGGNWREPPQRLRSAWRTNAVMPYRVNENGLRLARSAP